MSINNKNWRNRNPEKVRAHWIVSNAIRYGKLKRLPCQICGNEKSHAHHTDYSQPLNIMWLCHHCHWKEHGWVKQTSKRKPHGMRSDAKKPHYFEKVKALHESGYSYTDILKELPVSRASISRWLNNKKYTYK